MLLARVVGTVVATRKDPQLEGLKFLLLQLCDTAGKKQQGQVVAIDSVGAGVGDVVLYASGSSARQTAQTQNKPVDATVMAIVDLVEEQDRFAYRKEDDH